MSREQASTIPAETQATRAAEEACRVKSARAEQDPTTRAFAGSMPAHNPRRWLVLLVVWGLSAAYTATYLNRGWVPHDEGALAQSAERVLQGELPHQDFDEPYTGGLSYLNAFAFRALGTNLGSLRVPFFVFFVAWVPALYFIASRFASPLAAGSVSLLAVAWSVPNYTAAMPSWYNLFFAVFGIAALFRYLETDSRRWLFIAGVYGGLSFLAKLVGLYYVAAVLLFLVFREQCVTHAAQGAEPRRGRAYPLLVGAGLLLFLGVLFAVIRGRFGISELIHFVFPGTVLAALLLWREWRGAATSDRERFATLFRMLMPFGAGVVIPIIIFLIPYARSGSLSTFARGVFVLPAKRLAFAAWSPLGLSAVPELLPLAALLGIAMFRRSEIRLFWKATLVVVLTGMLVASAKNSDVYEFVWHSLVLMIPFTVLVGAVLLNRWQSASNVSVLRQQQVMMLLCVTAICSLVQFPFAAPTYLCYVAPLLVLALLAVLSLCDHPRRFVAGSLLGFYLAFAVLLVNPGFIYAMGYHYLPNPQTELLRLPRAGGLRVAPSEAQVYERLISAVQEHAADEYIYAAPDCPEVYFLSGLHNPTRTLLDFFDDPEERIERILSAIDTHGVRVAIIRGNPQFSPPLARDLRLALAERFPNSTTVGQFEVRWRP